jgi:Spy/CpxP family protein refolding chaperone
MHTTNEEHMKNKALWLLLCGYMAATSSAAIADTAVTVKQVAMTSTTDEDKALKFSDDQLERMHTIRAKFEDSRGARALEIHKLHRQIFDSLNTSTPDKAAIMATQGKINALESEQANERVQMMMDTHEILTPEQRQIMRRHLLEMDMRNPVGPRTLPVAPPGAARMVAPAKR